MATRRRGDAFISGNLDEMAKTAGVIKGISLTVGTDRFIEPVIERSHKIMANEFDMHMDMLREAYPDRFHHVYEWWNSPISWDQARLWEHTLKGSGTNRFAGWVWKPSKSPVPTHKERKDEDKYWSSHLDDDDISALSDRNYYFYWKAPIMEYNTPVVVTPKNAKKLFVPTPSGSTPFTFKNSVIIKNPGGEETTGSFTAAWALWWERSGSSAAQEAFMKTIDDGVKNSTIKALKKGFKTRTVNISTISSSKEAFEAGKKFAEQEFSKLAEHIERGNI